MDYPTLMTNKVQKILVIKLGALGDFILQTGQMETLTQLYPDAHITLMTGSAFVNLAKQTGWFHDYIIDNRTWKLSDWIRIIKQLAFGHYDIIFDLQMQRRTRCKYYFLARLLAPKKFCWAMSYQDRYRLIHVKKAGPLFWGKAHEEKLEHHDAKPSLAFCHGENKNFHLLPDNFVLMIPGCSPKHPYKRWPISSYATLAHKLANLGIASVVLGTSIEQKEIETICAATPQAVNFCNKASLLDIPDLARKALVVVGNDTGPTHMAELTHQPTISLFSEKTAPSANYAKNVHNIIKTDIADISPEEILSLIQSIIHKAK